MSQTIFQPTRAGWRAAVRYLQAKGVIGSVIEATDHPGIIERANHRAARDHDLMEAWKDARLRDTLLCTFELEDERDHLINMNWFNRAHFLFGGSGFARRLIHNHKSRRL